MKLAGYYRAERYEGPREDAHLKNREYLQRGPTYYVGGEGVNYVVFVLLCSLALVCSDCTVQISEPSQSR